MAKSVKKTTKAAPKAVEKKVLPLPNLPADWESCGPDCACAKGEPCDGSCGDACNCGGTNCAPKKPAPLIEIRDRLSEMAWAYWTGQMPLWGAFWVWGVLGGGVMALVLLLWGLPLWGALFGSPVGPQMALAGYGLLWVHGLAVGYFMWSMVSIWRCAQNELPVVRLMARAVVVLLAATWWPIYALAVMG